MTNCKSCKHWDKTERPPHFYENSEMIPVVGQWGTCERILRLSGDSYGTPPTLDEKTEDPAYLSDGSGYFASLTTRSDFGCSLWEARHAVG